MHEQSSTRFTNGLETTATTHGVDFSADGAVDLKSLQEWCNNPDVVESDYCKLTSPFHGNTDSVKCGQELVAKTLPASEAIVGTFPDAVDTVGAIRFSKDVVELD